VPEPDPFRDTIAKVKAVYFYRYPAENVDAEAMFIYHGLPYIISKEADRAVLYRFTELSDDATQVHVLDRVGELNGGAFGVTGASLSLDGSRLAASTYEQLWIYRTDEKTSPADLIKTEPWSLRHDMSAKAVGFKGHELILTNERQDIFRLSPWWYEKELDLPPRTVRSIFDHEDDVYPDLAEMETQDYRDAGVPLDGRHLVLLAEDVDARLTWPLDVPRSDRYTFSALMTRGPEYGRVQLYVDGQPAGDPQDLYAERVMGGSWVALGVPSITKGYHEFTFYVVGKSEKSAGYKVGVDSFHLQPASSFAHRFLMIGPFDKANPDDVDTPLSVEEDRNLTGSSTGLAGKPVAWRSRETRDDGLLSIGMAFP